MGMNEGYCWRAPRFRAPAGQARRGQRIPQHYRSSTLLNLRNEKPGNPCGYTTPGDSGHAKTTPAFGQMAFSIPLYDNRKKK